MVQDFWRLIGILLVSLLAGFALGQVFVCLCLGLLLLLGWYARKHRLLLDWLDKRVPNPPEVPGGSLDRIIEEFDSLHVFYRQRNEKLSSYLKQFQQATNALPDAVVVLNEDGNIDGANSKAVDYLNIHWPQDSGLRLTNLVRHPLLSDYLRDSKRKIPKRSLELFLAHDPQRRLELRIVPFGDTQRLLIARDVTRVYQANEMRKDFIANASHELRSPLTVIAGYLESFDNDEECPQSWQPLIQQMRNQTGRMQRLIEDLLELSSLESSDKPMHRETVHVADLLTSIYKEAESLSGGMNHIFFLETDTSLTINGNQRELYSAFSNLVFNAVQYTPSRGVIRIRWYQDEQGPHMAVSDTGEGIPEEHISRLTERFYRVEKGRSREKGGTGLGLAIVKHVLARHNASLQIESVYGEGSLFRCDFHPDSVVQKSPEDVSLIA